MKVHYRLGSFISHERAGQANMRALAAVGVDLVDDPARAEAVVVHDEPPFLAGHLAELGGFSGPLISYAVFEMDRPPSDWARLLAPADQVWTCSGFSRDCLAQAHPDVRVAPHVVERPRVTLQDMGRDADRVRDLLGMDATSQEYWFYTIADGLNPRKNLPALVRAFGALRTSMGPRGLPVCLAVKQYRAPLPGLAELPGVAVLNQELTEGEISALHALCHCYVSPHRCEAWGLSLSEAMALGKPVIATNWSGNLEFMAPENSLLLDYELKELHQADLAGASPWFEPGMHWAEPDEEHLVRLMAECARGRVDPDLGRRARKVAETYSPQAVGAIMRGLLEEVLAGQAR